MFVKMNELSDDSIIRVYIADRKLAETEQADLREKIETFLPRWRSEGKDFKSAYELLENQILVVAGLSEGYRLSGCTLDALKKLVEKWDDSLKANFTVVPKLSYRKGKEIISRNIPMFKQDILNGVVDENTIVFDNTVQTLSAFRKGIEFKLTDCWHNQILQQVSVAK